MIEMIAENPGLFTTALVFCPAIAIAVAGLLEAWGFELWMDD